jgi:hypothetical protein
VNPIDYDGLVNRRQGLWSRWSHDPPSILRLSALQRAFDKQLTAQDSRFYFNYHHTAADTFDRIDPRELNENAAVMAVLAYALAESASPAPR